jgi:hypothetical protein
VSVALLAGGHLQAQTRAELAAQVRDSKRITLATTHVSGEVDQASARQNILDTAAGKPARRSAYGTAPGGTVELDARLLKGLLTLARSYTFSVTEIAGGSHTRNLRHYAGIAVDVGTINGQAVSKTHPTFREFMSAARKLGATEVLGPGDRGHDHHVHVAWPR